jgi:hypothetical protein
MIKPMASLPHAPGVTVEEALSVAEEVARILGVHPRTVERRRESQKVSRPLEAQREEKLGRIWGELLDLVQHGKRDLLADTSGTHAGGSPSGGPDGRGRRLGPRDRGDRPNELGRPGLMHEALSAANQTNQLLGEQKENGAFWPACMRRPAFPGKSVGEK